MNEKLKKECLERLWVEEEDFRRINEEEMVFMIELFKFANDSSQRLRKPHPMSIQVLSKELLGYDILWKGLRWTGDEKAALSIC